MDDECVVPRGSKKSKWYDAGRVASMVDFNTSWRENQVCQHIEECFSAVLPLVQG